MNLFEEEEEESDGPSEMSEVFDDDPNREETIEDPSDTSVKKWTYLNQGENLREFCDKLLRDIDQGILDGPLGDPEDLVKELSVLYSSSMDKFATYPDLPKISSHYNPFKRFSDSDKLISYQKDLLNIPDLWGDLIDKFEEILPPEARTKLYNEIAPFMPNDRESGRGWYTSKRENGVFTRLFAEAYKKDPFYARIFPALRFIPDPLPEMIFPSGKVKPSKPSKSTCSTITGCERSFKTMCCYLINGLMEQAGVKAQLVEIDIVSCHARVLCYLFPNKTPLLSAVFEEDRNLWGETISYIPSEIVDVMAITTSAKKLVKIVAYKTLQSGLVKHDSIFKAIKDSIYGLPKEDQYTVVEALRKNPILAEFRTLFKEVARRAEANNLRVYSLFQEQPLVYRPETNELGKKKKTDQIQIEGGRAYCSNSFRFCSSILVGVELMVLCAIVSTLSIEKMEIPLNLEHDGCLCLIDISDGPLDIERLNRRFCEILFQSIPISNMKLEVKHLEFI